jgi:hypothetical protein
MASADLPFRSVERAMSRHMGWTCGSVTLAARSHSCAFRDMQLTDQSWWLEQR